MTIVRSWMQSGVPVCWVLCACAPSGEVAQPVVEVIALSNADLRDMVFDKRGADSDPVCLYIADANQNQVHCVNVSRGALDSDAALQGITSPTALALSRDEKRLYVGSESDADRGILEIELATLSRVQWTVAARPDALAVFANGRVAIGESAQNLKPAKIEYWDPQTVVGSTGTPPAIEGLRLLSAHDDGTLLAVADAGSRSPTVSIWRTETPVAVTIASDNYIGHLVQTSSSIVFHPVRHEFFVLSDGSMGASGPIPGYVVNGDKVDPLPIRFAADYPAVALAFTPDVQRVLVAHGTTRFDAHVPEHDLTVPDLHVFDAATGAEVGVIALPDHVHDRGISVAPDGTIYLLLGRDKATRIGVIRDPGT